MNFLEYTMEHVRLAVLRLLEAAPGYRANDSVLIQAVEQLGLPCTRAQLRTQLSWLEEQQLVRLEHPAPTLIVAIVTERGCEVAHGRAHVPGVQRPGAH